MVTIQDVAREANVSPATVSRVLNNSLVVSESKRKQVMDAVEKLGYELPVRTTRSGKHVLLISDVSNAEFSNAFYHSLSASGYQMVQFYNCEGQHTQDDLLMFLQSYPANQIAGIVTYNFVRPLNTPLFELLNKYPVVQIGSSQPFHQTVRVGTHRFQAAYEVTKHLLKKGCKRIAALVAGAGSIREGSSGVTEVLNGYRSALMDYNLTVDPSLIRECDFLVEGAYESVRGFLKETDAVPDAILCPMDTLAVGTMRAVMELGYRIPDDIRIMSLMNDWPAPFLSPSLSTVNYPREAVAKEVVRNLHQMILGEQMHMQQLFVPYTISYRESTEGIAE